jgi:hypothetical protein
MAPAKENLSRARARGLCRLPSDCDSSAQVPDAEIAAGAAPRDAQAAQQVAAISARLQLVLGDDRAEVSFHDLERLENGRLLEELTVVLRALPVVAATDILGRKMSGAIPTPAAWCRRIRVDRSCQLVMTAVADVAKSVEMAVLRLDESKPRVPERVSPVQGLKEWRIDLTSAI